MKKLKLYKVSQSRVTGHDTYDSMIVAAESKKAASEILPTNDSVRMRMWCEPQYVNVEKIGNAKEGTKTGLILASFNAG